MGLPQNILDAIENLIEEKFNELLRDHKVNAEVTSTDLTTFEEEQMLAFDGNEKIDQGFFRKFLRWLSNYINTLLANFQQIAFDEVKYVTPVDYAVPPDCGKIIAPFAHLVLTGAGVKPTIPDPSTTTPDEAGFDLTSDIMEGGFAYNTTDNLWYYRGKIPADDWFLPSKDELAKIYTNLHSGTDENGVVYTHVGGFINDATGYWVSSADTVSADMAYYISFNTGGYTNGFKNSVRHVRACRAFTSATNYNLRDIGPTNGLIFWKSGNNYLEATPTNQVDSVWSNITNAIVPGTSTAIGTGQANTTAIIGQAGHTNSAAKLCDDLSVVGQEDEILELKDALTGSDNYVHTQAVAATLWTVTHNMGKYPSVFIQDGTGHAMIGDIVHISINQLTIEFSTTKSGKAIIN